MDIHYKNGLTNKNNFTKTVNYKILIFDNWNNYLDGNGDIY